MERLNYARVCVEITKGAHLPSVIRLKSAGASSVDIGVCYHRKPSYPLKGRIANPNRKPTRIIDETPCLAETSELVGDFSVSVGGDLLTPTLLPSPAVLEGTVVAAFSGSRDVGLCGENVPLVETNSVDHSVEGSPPDDNSGVENLSVDHSLDPVLISSPQEDSRTAPGNIASSVVEPISLPLQMGPPFMALDQTPVVKRVRFAPEIASAEAPSCDPHRRLLAPCSDICHPSKFRRSNLGNLASVVVPVDDGPNPDAVIEHHVLSIPPSDGVSPVLEPASVIDPDLTPSPISRTSCGQSGKLPECTGFRSAYMSPEWLVEYCNFWAKLPGAFCDRSGIFRTAAFGPEWNGVLWSAAFGPEW
ncbi:hypothetical protein Nepgr_027227 [Nepenthes gracilis]|uniref:Uncharacterized protein n=1 Tax=Nepenthes gracilis TaxID=150966 RepID=A0AAD3TAF7_NEPGR|nr:hypothetical protein Nepgr_027227 [Nepenthes gracilis]